MFISFRSNFLVALSGRLFVLAFVWLLIAIIASANSPNHQLVILGVFSFFHLCSGFCSKKEKRDPSRKSDLWGNFAGWLVTNVVWTIMAIISKGTVPDALIYWATGILSGVGILCLVLAILLGSIDRGAENPEKNEN